MWGPANLTVQNTFLNVIDDDGHECPNFKRSHSCPPKIDEVKHSEPNLQQDTSMLEETSDVQQQKPTTMMIKNIPCRCQSGEIIQEINDHGFEGTFDFFFMPRPPRKTSSNLGYAFINFKSGEIARNFQTKMQGHRFSFREGESRSQKVCDITVAAIQGLENNKIKHHKDHRHICFFDTHDQAEEQVEEKNPNKAELSLEAGSEGASAAPEVPQLQNESGRRDRRVMSLPASTASSVSDSMMTPKVTQAKFLSDNCRPDHLKESIHSAMGYTSQGSDLAHILSFPRLKNAGMFAPQM